jgi:hypothetical protein
MVHNDNLYGHLEDRVVAQAREHGQFQMRQPEMHAQLAVTWARDHVFERSAVQDHRAILETALARGMGETSFGRSLSAGFRRASFAKFHTTGQADNSQLRQAFSLESLLWVLATSAVATIPCPSGLPGQTHLRAYQHHCLKRPSAQIQSKSTLLRKGLQHE